MSSRPERRRRPGPREEFGVPAQWRHRNDGILNVDLQRPGKVHSQKVASVCERPALPSWQARRSKVSKKRAKSTRAVSSSKAAFAHTLQRAMLTIPRQNVQSNTSPKPEKLLRLPQVLVSELSTEAIRTLETRQQEAAMNNFITACHRAARQMKKNSVLPANKTPDSPPPRSRTTSILSAKPSLMPTKPLSMAKLPPTFEHELLVNCEIEARRGATPQRRLKACEQMFELALRSNQQEFFVHVPGVLEVLIELANHGQVCEKKDALFRWPRAKCRQLAVRALESLSLESTSQFVKREAIRRGALVALCRAATEATPAPLILETRYERIDSETKAIVNAVLKRVDHEGLVRSLPISIKRAPQAAQELLRSELNRRTSNENIKVRHRDAELFCAHIRLGKDRSVEEKLLALRLESTAKAQRTRCQRNLERLLSKDGQFVLSQLAVDLAEEQPPDLEEEALAVAKLAAVDAEKAKALQEKLDRERAAREREERRIRHEVTSSLDAVIFAVEAREYSRQIFLEDVLQNGVLVTIDRLEADRAQEAQRVKDCKIMEVEDALASLVRDDEHRKLREERDCMTNEDKEGVRKAIKRMPKDLRRQFLLQEEEYLRRCENRDVLREQKRIQAEMLLMGEEDATALQLRTREMYAIKFEQHKIARELQPQAQDLSISASGEYALDPRSGEDSYEYYEHGHAAASEIVHDEYAQHDDSTMRNNTSGDLYKEYFGGAYGQGEKQQEGEEYASFEYDANEPGAYADYEVAQDQYAAHQGGDVDGYDEEHTKYYAGHETPYSYGQATYDNANTDEHYGEHQHQETTPHDYYYADHAEHADAAEYDHNAYDQYQEGDLAQSHNYAMQQEQAGYDNAYAGEQYDHQQHQQQDFAHYDNYYAEHADAVEYDYNAYNQYQAEGQYYEVQQTEPAQDYSAYYNEDYSAYYNEDAAVVAHQEMQDNYYESAAADVGNTANTTGVEFPDEQTGYYDENTGEYVQHAAFENGHEHGTTTQMEQEETHAANDTIDQGQWEYENFDAGEASAQGWIWDEAQQMWVESNDNQT